MAGKPVEIRIYVSWVDSRRDPWPSESHDGQGAGGAASEVAIFPQKDDMWPGVQHVAQETGRLLHIGPTLMALFHEGSRFRNAEELDHVYLLHAEDDPQSTHDQLKNEFERIAVARDLNHWKERVHLIPIASLNDLRRDNDIKHAMSRWIYKSWHDPFFMRYKWTRHVVVNCTPGTRAQKLCLREFDWKEATNDGLGNTEVELIQERSGLRKNGFVDELARELFEDASPETDQYGRRSRGIRLRRRKE